MARIIEISGLSGAYATRLFAEQGHEIIRVEKPEGNDLRRLPPFLGEKEDLEHGAYHQFLNAGKKSLALNLDSPAGQKIFLEMLSQSDALVADASLLRRDDRFFLEANPKLALTKILDDQTELCAMARSGLMSLTGHPGKAPVMLGGHVPLLAVGVYVAVATAAALLVCKTGKGMVATVSVRECLETFVEQAMIEYRFSGTITERRGSKGAITALSGALPCKNGHWVISQINRPGRWPKFLEWVQDPELASDPSLAQEEVQHQRRDFILDRLRVWAERFTNTELVEEAQRRHFPASPVSTPLDLVDDPQLMARGFLQEIYHPEFGRIKFPEGAIASVLGTQLTPAPRLGEHNTEILTQLGYSEDHQKTLIATGAIR